MRVVIQRVKQASVKINNLIYNEIETGLLIFLGIEEEDNQNDIEWLSSKISRLRIFPNAEGVMDLSVKEINGEILLISQFTLHASTKKGNRPSYLKAAKPEIAIPLYEKMLLQLSIDNGKNTKSGIFGANMQISLINDGPVTILIDSRNKE